MRTNHLLASTALTTSAMLASSAAWAAAPTTFFSWTGWYVGLNAGAAPTRIDHSVTAPGFFTSSANGRVGGVIFGGQAGYNLQFAPQWVAGVEGDINYLYAKRNTTFSFRNLTAGGGLEDVVGSQRSKVRWLSTIRGRFGPTWNRTFFYATGGLAIGGVNSSVTALARESDGGPGTTQYSGSHSSVRTGWTAGGGVEHSFTDRVSAKLEYLHFDLGQVGYTVLGVMIAGGNGLPLTWPAAARFSGDIIRLGVNIKIGP
jgi:outer membrane immunogenic protein